SPMFRRSDSAQTGMTAETATGQADFSQDTSRVTLRPARRQGGLICRRMKVNAAVPGSGIPERQTPAELVVAQVAASESGATADEFGAASYRRCPERQAPAEQVVAQVAASESGAAADEFGAARNRVP